LKKIIRKRYDEEGRSFAMDGKGRWTRIHALDYAGGLHDTWGEELKDREVKAREERRKGSS
jgi:hypothetical protein